MLRSGICGMITIYDSNGRKGNTTMKSKKRFGALALALVMLLSGCGQKAPGAVSGSDTGSVSGAGSGSTGDVSQTAPVDLAQVTDPWLATAGLTGDSVVARIGETEVTAAELLYWLNRNTEVYLAQLGGQVSVLPWDADAGGGTLGDQMKEGALEAAIYYRGLNLLAEREGLTPDSGVAISVDQMYGDMAAQMKSEETVEHMLWAEMLSRELLIYLNESGDLSDQLRERYFGEDSGGYPTDAEVQAWLDEQGIYRAKHILLATIDLDTREPLDEAAVAQKKAKADDILAQLRGAEDPITLFDQLMNEHSEDTGLAANPDGYTTEKGIMVAPFEEAALALKNGEISDIVESDFGYHIILRLPIDPESYRGQLTSQRLKERSDQLTKELGVEKTEAYGQIDPGTFWEKLGSLQTAVQAEVQAAQG